MIEGKSDAVGTISVLLAVLNGVIVIASVGTAILIRQRFFDAFAGFDVELPGGTILFLSIPTMIWLAAAVVLLAVLVAKEFIARKWIPLCLNLLFVLLAVGYWVVFVVAMMVPLIHIQQLK